MRRFYVSPEDVREGELVIQGSALHHLKNVLRFRKGEEVVAFDGKGKEYSGKIERITGKVALVKVADVREAGADRCPLEVCLCQAVIRFARMELVVEKCAELGVSKICPFVSERTVVRMDKEGAGKRVERWRRIARQACRQSGRTVFPEITEVVRMEMLLEESTQYEGCLIPWEEEKGVSLREVLRRFPQAPANIVFFIGPEGGFSSYEIKAAKEKGAIPVTLGSALLRSETAAVGMLSALMYEFGGRNT